MIDITADKTIDVAKSRQFGLFSFNNASAACPSVQYYDEYIDFNLYGKVGSVSMVGCVDLRVAESFAAHSTDLFTHSGTACMAADGSIPLATRLKAVELSHKYFLDEWNETSDSANEIMDELGATGLYGKKNLCLLNACSFISKADYAAIYEKPISFKLKSIGSISIAECVEFWVILFMSYKVSDMFFDLSCSIVHLTQEGPERRKGSGRLCCNPSDVRRT